MGRAKAQSKVCGTLAGESSVHPDGSMVIRHRDQSNIYYYTTPNRPSKGGRKVCSHSLYSVRGRKGTFPKLNTRADVIPNILLGMKTRVRSPPMQVVHSSTPILRPVNSNQDSTQPPEGSRHHNGHDRAPVRKQTTYQVGVLRHHH